MAAPTYLLLALCLLSFVSSGLSVKCWECNVWKAGYGHMCDNKKQRDNCKVCMKVETNSYIMRYSDTPQHSRTVSLVCGNYDMTHFGVECHYYRTADGYSTRCYCDTDLCNDAPSQRPARTAIGVSLALITAFFTRILVQ